MWRWLCLLVISLTSAASALAQSETDAFYIYQNDGHFDGFFYDQVQKIAYSRLDTAGVEWDDYVSQEIITADSTYRIMLSAIDSVSFVQPEIRFSPQLRMMNEDGLAQYVTGVENMMLVLRADVPADLRPKAGEVLACPSLPDHDGPFVGKVVTTYEFDGKLYVPCTNVTDLKDIFTQFITVEEVVSSDNGRDTRRRIAGMGPRRAEGNWNGDLFQMNFDVEDSYQLSDAWNFVIGLHCGFAMRAQVVYNITWTKFFLKMLLEERVEVGFKGSLDGSIGEFDNVLEKGFWAETLVAMSRLYFPAQFPLMSIDVAPKPFVRGEAHFNVGASVGASSRMFQQWFLISTEPPYFDFDLVSRNTDEWLKPSFSLTAELNGSLQAGVKFPFTINTAKYLDEIFKVKIGNTLYTGPKLTGALTLDLLKTFSGSLYEAFKDTKITATLYSFDNELTLEMLSKWGKPVKRAIKKSLPMGYSEFGLFPSFENVKYELRGDHQRDIHAQMDVNGEVFMPQTLGFALYDRKGNRLQYKTRDETYYFNTFNKVEIDFENLEPGSYIVRPISRMFNVEVPIYSEEKKINIEIPQINVVPSVLRFDEEGGTATAAVEGGYEDGPLTCSTEETWIHPTAYPLDKQVSVMTDPNETFRYREGKVIVTQRVSTTEVLSDTLTVKQYGGITVSVDRLSLPEEGATQIVNVMTNLSPVDVAVRDDTDPRSEWLLAELDGEALTVRASATNTTDRSAVIVLSAFNKAGDGIVTAQIIVEQKGLIDTDIDTLDVPRMGLYYKDVTVTTPLPTVTATTEAGWVTVSTYNNTVQVVQVKENRGEPREATVTITATDGTRTASKDIVIAQEGTEDPWPYVRAKWTSFSMKPGGGEMDMSLETNAKGLDYSIDGGDWLTVLIDRNAEQCTFKAGRNGTGQTRKATVTFTARNERGTDTEEVTVTQAPDIETREYDGFCVELLYGGDYTSWLMSEPGTLHYTYPNGRGAYGTGGLTDYSGGSFSSSGNDGYWEWDAYFTIYADPLSNKSFLSGSFRMQRPDDPESEGLRFNVSGAPMTSHGGPVKPNAGTFRGDTYWSGDGVACLPPEEVWGHSIPDGNVYIGNFDRWAMGKHESYWDRPVQVNIYFRRKDGGGELPWGHPDRQ